MWCSPLYLPKLEMSREKAQSWLRYRLWGALEVKWSEVSYSTMPNSLWPRGLYSPWNSPGQNTGMGRLSFLQIFPTHGWNPGISHYRQILYQLRHKGSPRILEWVAYPFSSGSSQPRNPTGVSCIAGGFLPTELLWKPILVIQLLGNPILVL